MAKPREDGSAADRVRYRSWMSDNLRWDALELREGDIVISTPPKCGTTWTQRLVSLLVFDGPDLPGPLSLISPWLDLKAMPIEDVVAALDAQQHRRFIKTHTPLDGLLLDERVTYLVIGRDPRDAAVSMLNDQDRIHALHEVTRMPNKGFGPAGQFGPGGPPPPHHEGPPPPRHDGPPPPRHDGPPPPPGLRRTPLEAMQLWLERPIMATEGIVSLATILHHYETAWTRRHMPNVAAFHYVDYQTDVVAEMTRLAEVLAIDVSGARIAELAEHATMEAMRTHAADLSPELWPSHESFFRAGGAREWRDIFTEAEHERYRQRGQELVAPEVLAWAHDGRRAVSWSR
jgi:aryl sulfotransferase